MSDWGKLSDDAEAIRPTRSPRRFSPPRVWRSAWRWRRTATTSPRFVRFLEGLLSTPERQVSLDRRRGRVLLPPDGRDDHRLRPRRACGSSSTASRSSGPARRCSAARSTSTVLRAAQVTRAAQARCRRSRRESSGGISAPPVEIVIDGIALPQIDARRGRSPAPRRSCRRRARRSVTAEALAAQLTVDRQDRAGSLSADLRFEPAGERADRRPEARGAGGGLLAELLRAARPAGGRRRALRQRAARRNGRPISTMQADGARVVAGAHVDHARRRPAIAVVAELAAALETRGAGRTTRRSLAGESRRRFDVDARATTARSPSQSATLRSEGVDLAASGALSADMVPQQRRAFAAARRRRGAPRCPSRRATCRWRASASTPGSMPARRAPWRVRSRRQGVESAFGRVDALRSTRAGRRRTSPRPANRAHDVHAWRRRRRASRWPIRRSRDAHRPDGAADGAGSWSAGQPVAFDNLQARADRRDRELCGHGDARASSTAISRRASSISSRFAALAGRPLAGSARAAGERHAPDAAAAFDLTLDGEATRPRARHRRARSAACRRRRGSRAASRARRGRLRFDGLTLSNERVTAELNGSLADPALDLAVSAERRRPLAR